MMMAKSKEKKTMNEKDFDMKITTETEEELEERNEK